ncbi:pheophytinase, chloroplastic-like [Nymphaea colorata]|nr:pheophytinase, chloroplastic-like [Nymphaea colorata]
MPSLAFPHAGPLAFIRPQPLAGCYSPHPARGALLSSRFRGASSTSHQPLQSTSFLLRQPKQNQQQTNRRSLLGRAFASSTGRPTADAQHLRRELEDVYRTCKIWRWRGHAINFSQSGTAEGPPLLLVHGFGASVGHWRRNIKVLAESHTVFAIDLLGFGASDKPAGFAYEMEIWAQLILDFLEEVVQKPTVLIGNSVGSLACLIAAASESQQGLVRGLVLLNCAGGMNNKAIVDDWRIKLLLPFLLLFDFLLRQRRIASFLFERVKSRETLKGILLSVYGNKDSVDDELVEIINGPAEDEGALDAFVSIVTGPPGPNPTSLMQNISLPVLILWGDRDPFTPLDGPVGRYFASLPSRLPNVNLFVLEGVGHCPHDDRPDLVHEKLLPWLDALPET